MHGHTRRRSQPYHHIILSSYLRKWCNTTQIGLLVAYMETFKLFSGCSLTVSPHFHKFEVTTLSSARGMFSIRVGGSWTVVAGELTSNMKVKWQAGHNKVSIGVSPFQTSQEQSGRKRPSQLLADVSGRMFHWQTRGRRRSLMVPLVTSNLHLAGREICNTPVKTSVCNLRHPTQLTLAPDRIFWRISW